MKILLLIFCLSVIYSCKTNKSNNNTSENIENGNEIIVSETPVSESDDVQNQPVKKQEKALAVEYKPKEDKKNAKQDENVYSLVVSFYSKGEGIDYKSQLEYSSLLKKNESKLNYEEVRWGREGEIDYCINLNNMSAQKKQEFISETRNLLSKSNLVHINENEQCVHKR